MRKIKEADKNISSSPLTFSVEIIIRLVIWAEASRGNTSARWQRLFDPPTATPHGSVISRSIYLEFLAKWDPESRIDVEYESRVDVDPYTDRQRYFGSSKDTS